MEIRTQYITDPEIRQIEIPARVFRNAIQFGMTPEEAAYLADIAMLRAKGLRGKELRRALDKLYEEA
jgi:hypothetical protein